MPQIILIGSYTGLSDYVYDVLCTGRRLSIEEVTQAGFVDQKDLGRDKIDYTLEWYEIHPGDRISISRSDDCETFHVRTFTIPDQELPDPPQRIKENNWFNRLHEYLEQHCKSE